MNRVSVHRSYITLPTSARPPPPGSPDIPDLQHDLGFNHETIEELKNITPDDVDDVLREHGIVSDSGVIVMNESLATADGPSYGDTRIKSRTTDEK